METYGLSITIIQRSSQALKTLTPQGDGNLLVASNTPSTYHSFENTYPARGWKRDNSLQRQVLKVKFLWKHLPRKGMETKMTAISFPLVFIMLWKHLPRKGMETHLTCWKLRAIQLWKHLPRKGMKTKIRKGDRHLNSEKSDYANT